MTDSPSRTLDPAPPRTRTDFAAFRIAEQAGTIALMLCLVPFHVGAGSTSTAAPKPMR
jgi:hypothetical protein